MRQTTNYPTEVSKPKPKDKKTKRIAKNLFS